MPDIPRKRVTRVDADFSIQRVNHHPGSMSRSATEDLSDHTDNQSFNVMTHDISPACLMAENRSRFIPNSFGTVFALLSRCLIGFS